MTRVEITLGLLAILGAVAITALVGLGEVPRMETYARGFDVRSAETGAQLFDQYCSACHGPNASGLNCPPLNELSGLHGGDLGPGVAWRLEELRWDRNDSYGYVYAAIASGRTLSTRPDRYRGTAADAMQMPAWSQEYGGPLRPDQIKDLANYIVAFRDFLPAAEGPDAYEAGCAFVAAQMAKEGAPQPSVAGYVNPCIGTFDADMPVVPTPRAAEAPAAAEAASAITGSLGITATTGITSTGGITATTGLTRTGTLTGTGATGAP